MVHAFSYTHKDNPLYFLWDSESGSLLSTDYVAFLCAKFRYGQTFSDKERADFSAVPDADKSDCNDEISSLEESGELNRKPHKDSLLFKKKAGDLKALCLHVCHDCNLRCDYCFASGGTYKTARDYMSIETGKAAVDFLIKNSGTKRNLEIDFFGGEPLLNMELVKAVVDYAKSEGGKNGKVFSFTITTNCLALNEKNIDYINAEMENIVLSVDGRKHIHNLTRHSINGKDVYGKILENAKAMRAARKNKRYYVRGTFTARNTDFANDVFSLANEGFDQISVEPVVLDDKDPLALTKEMLPAIFEEYEKLAEGILERRENGESINFFHFMLDLEHGPCVNKRLTGCGAGTEYLAVSPSGKLYPCHQFVGKDGFLIGNVFDGISDNAIREKFASVSVLKKPHCENCPAKYYCGGGCAANALNFTGAIDGQYEIGCEMTKKRMEISLAIAAIEQSR